MNQVERQRRVKQYAAGPAALEAALQEVPDAVRTFRPASGAWTVHEIVVHCADSETSGYSRIRMLASEPNPILIGYDQDQWATDFDYHHIPLESSLAVIRAVCAQTAALIATFPEEIWKRQGTHSQSGPYSAEDWLSTYSVHLSDHADQIRRNLATWRSLNPEPSSTE